jgi:dihydrofolate synthase/folylpolyglutamate synthase
MSDALTSIEQAEAFLLSYSPEKQSGETYTLGRMRALMERLGNPQNHIPTIHIAGTSGKTSTAYFIRGLLEAHGQKTGLTSSPHITSIAERVQVGGKPLDDETFVSYLNEFIATIKQWSDITPTYFELLTAFAFWVFKRESVDYMIIEVGLGGLLDATNVIESDKVCVITPIGLDHTEILGSTIAEIAAQKAGIITKRAHVFSAQQENEAGGVIQTTCKSRDAKLKVVLTVVSEFVEAPLFQQTNFSLAAVTVQYIAERDRLPNINNEAFAQVINQTPPGRFEVYNVGDKTVIIDGAHNPQKLQAFVQSLRLRHNEPISWLVGFVSAPEEKVISCLEELKNDSDEYTFTDFSVGQDIKGRKSVPAQQVESLMEPVIGRPSAVIVNPKQALNELLLSKKRTVVVTGSLYLVAQLRQVVIDLAT